MGQNDWVLLSRESRWRHHSLLQAEMALFWVQEAAFMSSHWKHSFGEKRLQEIDVHAENGTGTWPLHSNRNHCTYQVIYFDNEMTPITIIAKVSQVFIEPYEIWRGIRAPWPLPLHFIDVIIKPTITLAFTTVTFYCICHGWVWRSRPGNMTIWWVGKSPAHPTMDMHRCA